MEPTTKATLTSGEHLESLGVQEEPSTVQGYVLTFEWDLAL